MPSTSGSPNWCHPPSVKTSPRFSGGEVLIFLAERANVAIGTIGKSRSPQRSERLRCGGESQRWMAHFTPSTATSRFSSSTQAQRCRKHEGAIHLCSRPPSFVERKSPIIPTTYVTIAIDRIAKQRITMRGWHRCKWMAPVAHRTCCGTHGRKSPTIPDKDCKCCNRRNREKAKVPTR